MTDADYSAADVDADSEPVVRSRQDGERVSQSVVRAVSEATDTEPLEMPQLGAVIDPDALDALFLEESTWADGAGTGDGTVCFRFHSCDVTVHADGRTVVSRTPEALP